MDEDENTKNTFSFEGKDLQNPAVVISTVAMEERCWRFLFFWGVTLHHWMIGARRFGRQCGCLMLKSAQCP